MTEQIVYPRISARQGQYVDLDAVFFHGGVPADPWALRRIEIYKTQPVPHNLIDTILVVDPAATDYPSPVQQEVVEDGQTVPTPLTGRYHLLYQVPRMITAPDVLFDVWYYYPDNPCVGSDCNLDDQETITGLLSCCNRFWLYPDQWFCGDGLQTVRFGFEPLDQRFHQPEIRPLEIGLMPLPLYDYNYNLVNPLIPFLRATISIGTTQCENLVADHEMEIGLRQGSYRSNPWVLKYLLDTSKFLKGTYQYRVTIHLPDGTSRTSQNFVFTVM